VSEFDEKLNALLSNPDSMAQIMHLAQTLSGQETSEKSEAGSAPSPPPKPAEEAPPGGGEPFSAPMAGLDPGLLTRLLPLVQEMNGGENADAQRLLQALKPYLKPERQQKVERALQLARLIHIGKKFFAGWEGS